MPCTHDVEVVPRVKIIAHSSLRQYFGSGQRLLAIISPDSYVVEFVDYPALGIETGPTAPVLLPVGTEHQAEQLHSVRAQHPMSLLIAITHDVTGHTTYYAMRSGADFVINLAISGEQQSNLLSAHLRGCPGREPGNGRNLRLEVVSTMSNTPPSSGAGAPDPTPGHGCGPRTDTAGHTTADPRDRRRALSRFDIELADMLRTHMTVAEIARHNYMSERSMYRRIRALYNTLGVTSRVELISSMNGVGPDRDPAALGA